MQVDGGAPGDCHIRCATELPPVADGLLEVPADDLLALGQIAVDVLEPRRESLVQIRAGGLGQPVIGGIADQEVPEAKRLVVAERGWMPAPASATIRKPRTGRSCCGASTAG